MKMWSDLLLSWAKSKREYQFPLQELYESPVCVNKEINRRLSMDALHQVISYMKQHSKGSNISPREFADYVNETSKDKVFIYWRSVQELADAVYKWADRNAKIGSVETVVDIYEDPDNKSEIFFKIPIEVVLKALYALQVTGKAQVRLRLFRRVGILLGHN